MKTTPFDRYRLKQGKLVSLRDWDPDETCVYDGGKKSARESLLRLNQKLDSLQELLYAEHKYKVLVILQGMDTSGKDGTIRRVFEGVNPQGVKVFSFKKPVGEELAHDFLWRIHRCVPGNGEIVIFNRSHYEDVVAVRVHNLVSKDILKSRYESINDFEKMLVREGVTILKFFLHISKDEQKKRLEDRLKDKRKQWKFNKGDIAERALWNDYMEAYESALSRTSTQHAPWYIVPSNKNWYRNLAVATLLTDALEKLDMRYPKADVGIDEIVIE